MTVGRDQLAELVPDTQKERVHAHALEGGTAEEQALQILTEAFHEQRPWGLVLLEYWLSANLGIAAETRVKNLRVATQCFERLWMDQNKPATLTALEAG